MRKEKFLAFLIVVSVFAVTWFFFEKMQSIKFSGRTDDLIIAGDQDSDFYRRINEQTAESEQLVAMVTGENILTIAGLKVLDGITRKFGRFATGESDEGGAILDDASSITNLSVQKSNYVTDNAKESKEPKGCPYAFREAERLYFETKTREPKVIIFSKGESPTFPNFAEGAMNKAIYFIDHFSLWQTLPETENELRHFEGDVMNSVYLRNFISPSRKCAAILLTIRKGYEDPGAIVRILRAAADESERENAGYKIDIVGYMVLADEMKRNIKSDSMFFIKLSALFIVISFLICFWTIRGVTLPFMTLAFSEIWLLGSMAMMGYDLNIVLYIVPVFVVAVGSSSSIHILSHFYQDIEKGTDHIDAAFNSAKELFVPIVTAASTTAFGFGALTLSGVKGLNVFVYLCILGLAITTFLSLFFIPAMNILLPKPRLTLEDRAINERKWVRLIHFIITRRVALIVAFLIMSAASLYGISKISPDNDLTKLLDKDSETLKLSHKLSEQLAGSTQLTLILEGIPGWPIRKNFLDKISQLQEKLETSPYVDKTTSIADIFKVTNHLSRAGRSKAQSVAEEQYQIFSHLHFIHSIGKEEAYKESAEAIEKLLSTFLNRDCTTAKILIRSNLTSLQLMKEEVNKIKADCRAILGEHVQPTVIGSILSINKAIEKILYGQTQGVILALFTIFVLMLVLFFSFKIAVLCLLPNIFPIAFFYGLLGLSKIGLDLSSGLVACVAIGIAVDDTIHFMVEFKKQLKRTYVTEDAMVETMKRVGSPIILTSFVLAVMFGVLYFSKFPVMSNLGILQSGTMVACLVCNLLLLPAVLASVRIVSIWDILRKFYDFDPARIPVFLGLSRLAIKLLLSLGKLVEFGKGDAIIRKGEIGEEMFVIIEGEAEVIIERAGNVAMRVPMGRGAIIGEMAVLGGVRRTATVNALSPVRVVSISKEYFVTASWLYPRTVNKFLLNIISVITHRMVDTSDKLLNQDCPRG